MKIKRFLSAFLVAIMLLSVYATGITAAEKIPFTDVPEGEWYYDAVAYTYAAGLMNGTGNGSTFSPMVNLTRELWNGVLVANKTKKEQFCSFFAFSLSYFIPSLVKHLSQNKEDIYLILHLLVSLSL